MTLLNAFTIDVEDYFHVTAFESGIDRSQWDAFDGRVESNNARLLELLSAHNVRATFFVLGWVAKKCPQLVKDIHAAGHEVASHGLWHRLIYQQSPAEFREDIRASREELQSITGCRVTAYRAPSFSITKASEWALEILVEEGFQVDSSIYPIQHQRGGMPDAHPEIHFRETPAGPICEFPPSIFRVAGKNIPISGGGYFRLFPLRMTLRLWRRMHRQSRPGMFYIHPWEIDPEQPRLKVAGRLARFRHYVNLHQTEQKLRALLTRFRFGAMADVLAEQGFDETAQTEESIPESV